jgi:hypothetical protein
VSVERRFCRCARSRGSLPEVTIGHNRDQTIPDEN